MYTEIYDRRTIYFDAVRFSDHLDVPFEEWLNDQANLPTVSLTSPANGTQFLSGSTLSMTASAMDPGGQKYGSPGNIVHVEFFAGQCSIGKRFSMPYSVSSSLPDGSYALTAVVTDGDGNTQVSDPVTVFFGNRAPEVKLLEPIARYNE